MSVRAPSDQGTLELLAPTDAAWRRHFDELPLAQQDVFYSPGYAQLCARTFHREAAVRCAVQRTETSLILYPFAERAIESLIGDRAAADGSRDITGLYGRGGLVCDAPVQADLARFHDAFAAYCQERQIVCGFDRYHPVLENHRLASPRTALRDVGGFVVIPLAPPIDELEARYTHALRKHIKKAERAGVEVFAEETLDHAREFLAIYTSTLDRRAARRFYYVDRGFLEELAARLPGRFRFFYAALGGVIVSCELVLSHGLYCHSFLGGTSAAALAACPNHLLKRQVIREAKASGCRYYLLGGGQRPDDGIWRYKRCFAVQGSRPSVVGGTVFDEPAYAALRQRLAGAGIGVEAGRFQFYDPT